MPVAEEVKLLAAASEHLASIVTLALDTGMRRGELLHQRSEDIDFERRILFVSASKTPEGEMRPIPLTKRAFQILSKLCKPSGVVFTYKDHVIGSLKTGWRAALRRAAFRTAVSTTSATPSTRVWSKLASSPMSARNSWATVRAATFTRSTPTSSCHCSGTRSCVSRPGTRPDSVL